MPDRIIRRGEKVKVKERESKLEEDTWLLREEQNKQQIVETEFKSRVKEVETQESKLEQDGRLLREDQVQQQALGDELTTRAKEVEKREAKLKEDIRLFQDEQLVQAQKLENELKSRIEKVEMQEEK